MEQFDKSLGREMHNRLLAGDPTAQATIAEQLLPKIQETLVNSRRGRRADGHLVNDAVTDAFFEYVANPSNFDPSKGSLQGFLFMAAGRNLLNNLKKSTTRKKYEKSVEHALRERKSSWEEEFVDQEERTVLLGTLPGGTLEEKIANIFEDENDQAVCLLFLNGEKDTRIFADALKLVGDQLFITREVKRRKDKVIKILQRLNKK